MYNNGWRSSKRTDKDWESQITNTLVDLGFSYERISFPGIKGEKRMTAKTLSKIDPEGKYIIRVSKQKRLFVEGVNKKLLGESMININNVLHIMNFKFGRGDLTTDRVEEFDNWVGEIKDRMSDEEYSTLFNDWLGSDDMGKNYEEYKQN